MATPDTSEPTIYRLKDIDTEEVSIVDRAANQRKFLVVKGANMKAGAQVSSDGKGGHTVAKDTPPTGAAPAAPGAPAAGAPPATPAPAPAPAADPNAPAPGGPQAEPVLQLSPEAKAELAKRVEAAEKRLAALKAIVAGATEVAGLVEVPAAIATAVAELLTGLAQGETEKSAAVVKGLPQFSGARVAQLVAAREALDVVLGSIAKPEPAATPDPAAAPAETIDDQIAKAIAKATAGLEAKVAAGLEKIAGLVAKHGEAIEKQAGRVEEVAKGTRPTPRSGPADGNVERTEKGDDEDDTDGSWSPDMADPDKHKVEKVAPDVRFSVPKKR